MPRTWSNRKIDHIDLAIGRNRPLPRVLWAFVAFTVLLLSMFSVMITRVLMHPVQVEIGANGKPIPQGNPFKGADFGH